MRYIAAAGVLVVVSFAALAFGEGADPVEDVVVTAAVDDSEPAATPTPLPTPTRAPAPAPETDVATAVDEVANTEPAAELATAPEPLVDGFYVPNFVGGTDRTATGTDRSVPDPTPAPIATPAPQAQPEPQPQPTPTPDVAPDPTPTPEPQATVTPEPDDGDGAGDEEEGDDEPSGGDPTAAQWEALRQCESGGNYSILSPGGAYRGAYQFSQATWDWIAGMYWPELEGVDPAQAAPADQDKMAFRLYDVAGWQQWPVCGQHLL